ncbi:MAG: hypothetical protein BWY72_01842 [Bacteroidetes bacterium ADurb.Bin416]|jgi:DNA gyrase/topoisomerase IV subunit A|nr:MAG: hypothetical protein BWY72_01842 [Bacteroidetes bacterium ADurb.Bin416]
MQKRNVIILIILVVLLAGGLVYLGLSLRNKDVVIREMTQEFELQKEALTDEYSQLTLQYEGYGLRIGNDSLASLLDNERYKVQRLLDELKITKATNAKRISELRKELETLRGIIKTYVAQIDSLSRINTALRKENQEVTQRYHQEREQVLTLSEEKKALTEKVTLASILEARNISIEALTDRGRKATRISKTAQLKFNFVIGKNISAPRGEKYIYLRIVQPDETVLVKRNDNVFLFEERYISYSARRPIEYEGEDVNVTIYWDVEEYLHPGSYRAELFADGYLIGHSTFALKD